ncbi:MAG: MBOAT family protein [Clostridia bacterium]|nr:MBOAT family protein [Clostridia bacterium]
MTFSSTSFLFFFFPIVFLSYFIIKNRTYRNVVLLLASLFFYAWGEPVYIVLMLAASLIAYLGGIVMEKTRFRKTALVITLVLLVSNLFVFKYLNFLCDNIGVNIPTIALPIGISFYTFQIISYVADLYKGKVALQRNFFYLTLYVSFFPQLIAGPIVRYQTIEEEILNRNESLDGVVKGLRRFTVGLAKKVIIANNVALVCTDVYDGGKEFGTAMYWLAAVCYALQIYFDFSGYSDMAIGLGKMFGFNFLENFNYPYIADSVTDFWRRWHISLSSWFRDYIYIPLGGNRCKPYRHIFNICAVWALTGLWHGASWNFVLWGIYYAALLLLEKYLLGKLLSKCPKIIRWLYTMFFVLISWVIFDRTDFSSMTNALVTMFTFRPTDWNAVFLENTSILTGLLFLPIGVLSMFPISKKVKLPDILANILTLAALFVCIVFIISSSFNPFIYFRF